MGSGCVIKVVASTCEVTVGDQTGLKSVTYTDVGSGKTEKVEVSANVNNIAYNESSGCPRVGTGTQTNGEYAGKVLTEGKNSLKAEEGVFVK